MMILLSKLPTQRGDAPPPTSPSGPRRLSLGILSAALALASTLSVWSAYVPPVGIPAPSFGIEESHTRYRGQNYDYTGDGVPDGPYKDAGSGPFSHYIDVNSPNATDSSNPFGSPEKPRKTIPKTLPAGSVVEVHGGPYTLDVLAQGTRERPVFVRGTSQASAAVVSLAEPFKGSSYLIVENMKFIATEVRIYQTTHHLAIRYCEITDFPMPPYCEDKLLACYFKAVLHVGSDVSWASGQMVEDIVLFRNQIHDNGDYVPTYESGVHAISLGRSCLRVWVLDNDLYRNAEDGLQIFGGGRGEEYARSIYIGHNRIYDNGENALDIKQSYDVIISENEMHGYRKTNFPKSGSDGAAIVLNDDKPNDRLWVINNRIWNSTTGIRSQSAGNVYIVGNQFSQIVHEPAQALATTPGKAAGVAVWLSSAASAHISHNTITDCDGGIYVLNGGNYTVENNIVSEIRDSTTWHLALNTGVTGISFAVRNNLLHQLSGSPRIYGKITCVDCSNDNPLLAGTLSGDVRLSLSSPGIDSGTESAAYAIHESQYGLSIARDLNGVVRPQNGAWDIGATEFSGAPSAPTGLRIVD